MGREKIIVGKAGERIAADFLRKRGYRILSTNVRTPFGEIDIIAREKRHLVFVEVKTRLSSSLGPPLLSITPHKVRRMIRNALFYLKKRNRLNIPWRIDIVSVKLDRDFIPEYTEVIQNAIEEDGWYI